MKKHKVEIAALALLLGVLCYAFYDSNIKGSEQKVVIANELLSMKEIKNKNDITLEMLAVPALESKEENITKEDTTEEIAVPEEVVETNEVEEAYEYEPVADYTYQEASYNESLSNEIVNYALQFEGGPYVYGGNSLTEGTDCSGFTKLVFANFGINLPRVARDQAYSGSHVNLSDIKPGDIVVSGYDGVVCHASLYIGDGKLIHALNSNTGIVVTDLYIMPIIDVRRVI